MGKQLHPALIRLIQALAEDAAREDYLAAQAAPVAAVGAERTD